jgi:hypothetical protein
MLDFDVAAKPKKAKKAAPPPAARDPFDVAPVRDALKAYEAEVASMKQTAENHQVVDDESNRSAVEMAAQAKRLAKLIEDMRKEKVGPYQQYTKAVTNLAKVYTDVLENIERIILKPKINAYLSKLKLERLEAERRAQEEARRLQERLDAESAEKNLPRVEVQMPVLPQKQEPVRTEEGSASQRADWKWKLVDIAQVPREYLVIDSVALNKAVRAGARVIPGIEIYQEESVQIRL